MHSSISNIEAFTASLKKNSEKIDDIVKNVDGVFAKADKAMTGVQNLTGTGDDKNPGEIAETMRSFRTLAEDVDKKTVTYFNGLIAEARRVLVTVDTAVKNFDRNPQRVIFGGGSAATAAPAAPATGTQGRR